MHKLLAARLGSYKWGQWRPWPVRVQRIRITRSSKFWYSLKHEDQMHEEIAHEVRLVGVKFGLEGEKPDGAILFAVMSD